MPYFVLAGRPDCPNFAHVVYVSKYLANHLPNFHLRIIQKKTGKWENWLQKMNLKYNWNVLNSPVIYKQLIFRGGIPHLIGGISEFWEYCYEYYRLQSLLPREDLEKMVEDNMRFVNAEEEALRLALENKKHITLIGASNPMLITLLPELCKMKELDFGIYTKIKLYDRDIDLEEVHEFVESVVEDISVLALNVEIVTTLQDALESAELLLIIDDLTCKPNEEVQQWHLRNIVYMHQISDAINAHASRNMRVVVAHHGPVCLNATLLIESCISIKSSNIVAITSDLGLGVLSTISTKANISLEDLGAPPVWGCIGINEFVDVGSIMKKCDVYRPNSRVLKTNGGSTLPLGTIRSELRLLNYITEDLPDLWEDVNKRKTIIETFHEHPPAFAKVRAITSFLKLWYAEEPSDEIISLGVCANGSFGLTNDIVYSQPVILEKKVWIPFKKFPVLEFTKERIKNMQLETEEFLDNYIIKPSCQSVLYI